MLDIGCASLASTVPVHHADRRACCRRCCCYRSCCSCRCCCCSSPCHAPAPTPGAGRADALGAAAGGSDQCHEHPGGWLTACCCCCCLCVFCACLKALRWCAGSSSQGAGAAGRVVCAAQGRGQRCAAAGPTLKGPLLCRCPHSPSNRAFCPTCTFQVHVEVAPVLLPTGPESLLPEALTAPELVRWRAKRALRARARACRAAGAPTRPRRRRLAPLSHTPSVLLLLHARSWRGAAAGSSTWRSWMSPATQRACR